jgi:hypothetical protein
VDPKNFIKAPRGATSIRKTGGYQEIDIDKKALKSILPTVEQARIRGAVAHSGFTFRYY